jgi:bifunctional non-homologous end joining protein LigD
MPSGQKPPAVVHGNCKFTIKMTKAAYARIEGQVLKLTNLEKVLYPATGFTKTDLIRYYRDIGPIALPHIRERPFTLKRFPSGVEAEGFFQKQCPSHRPKWVRTGRFDNIDYCLVNDMKTLLWIANLAAIELHTTLATIAAMNCPTAIAFDLDPGDGTGIPECLEVALMLKSLLAELGLESFPKTSGGKGIHVYLPLNTSTDYGHTRQFARMAAELLERQHPDAITTNMAKSLRTGKVFIDWSQNVDFKTTVSAYSLRANRIPSVSMPIRWSEVKAARRATSHLPFGPEEALRRVHRWGDIFEPVLSMKQTLPPPSALNLPPIRLKFAG